VPRLGEREVEADGSRGVDDLGDSGDGPIVRLFEGGPAAGITVEAVSAGKLPQRTWGHRSLWTTVPVTARSRCKGSSTTTQPLAGAFTDGIL
jgi:hypothetical protein